MCRIYALPSMFVQVDRCMERIPLASTLSSLVKIFIRTVCCCVHPTHYNKNRYFSYVNKQHGCRVFTLLFPFVGNFCVWLMDFSSIKGVSKDLLIPKTPSINPPQLPRVFPKPCTAEEYYEEGRKAAKDKNYQKAVELYVKASENDHVMAHYRLAKCYERNKGVKKSESNEWLSRSYYKKAAEHHHEESALILAQQALKNREIDKFKKWLDYADTHKEKIGRMFDTCQSTQQPLEHVERAIKFCIASESHMRKMASVIAGKHIKNSSEISSLVKHH